MPTLQATRHHHWSYLNRGLRCAGGRGETPPPPHWLGINNTDFAPVLEICPTRIWNWNWNMFLHKRYQVRRPVLVLVLVFVTWTCARDVIAEEIFVTSILQPQSWIQINWTWLCVLHIRSLLDSRWIDTYFILGDKKIAVDLNSIRCSLKISEAKPGQPA